MRPVFLSRYARIKTPKPLSFKSRLIGLVSALGLVSLLATTLSVAAADPMQDQTSLIIREQFAQCRDMGSEIEQYYCTCSVLEKQCEAPRKLEHGDWNTVEYWPSNDEADREVQFVLFASYDMLGEAIPVNSGMVMTCMAGNSDLKIFVGNDINESVAPVIDIDGQSFEADYYTEDGEYLLGMQNTDTIYDAMKASKRLGVVFQKSDGTDVIAEFQTFGFEAVTLGWQNLCFSESS